MHSRHSILAGAVALALTGSAGASDSGDMFTLRGFGTAGIVYSNEADADYVHNPTAQTEGVGRTHSVSADTDSRTAVQLDAKFTDRFSAVIQLVSEPVYNNSWDDEPQKLWEPSLQWANVSYRVTNDLTVRGGRIVFPFLMSAEFQGVGYANHWMRTPVEIYGRLPFSSVDGGDITYKHSLGRARNTIRAYYGTQDRRAPAPLASGDASVFGVIDTVEMGALTLRGSYATGEIDRNGVISKPELFALGATYDVNQWFVMSEVVTAKSSNTPTFTAGYVSGGVRIDKWTPFATVATSRQDSMNLVSRDQSTASIGVRWDARANMALKAQYDYLALPSDSVGSLINRTSDFKPGTDVSLFGLSVDFVF
ncbi:MAG TPA: hypothetical protein VIU34_08325 [Steroidobacter sp.]